MKNRNKMVLVQRQYSYIFGRLAYLHRNVCSFFFNFVYFFKSYCHMRREKHGFAFFTCNINKLNVLPTYYIAICCNVFINSYGLSINING